VQLGENSLYRTLDRLLTGWQVGSMYVQYISPCTVAPLNVVRWFLLCLGGGCDVAAGRRMAPRRLGERTPLSGRAHHNPQESQMSHDKDPVVCHIGNCVGFRIFLNSF
jgi:hypothetical protein